MLFSAKCGNVFLNASKTKGVSVIITNIYIYNTYTYLRLFTLEKSRPDKTIAVYIIHRQTGFSTLVTVMIELHVLTCDIRSKSKDVVNM